MVRKILISIPFNIIEKYHLESRVLNSFDSVIELNNCIIYTRYYLLNIFCKHKLISILIYRFFI